MSVGNGGVAYLYDRVAGSRYVPGIRAGLAQCHHDQVLSRAHELLIFRVGCNPQEATFRQVMCVPSWWVFTVSL